MIRIKEVERILMKFDCQRSGEEPDYLIFLPSEKEWKNE